MTFVDVVLLSCLLLFLQKEKFIGHFISKKHNRNWMMRDFFFVAGTAIFFSMKKFVTFVTV